MKIKFRVLMGELKVALLFASNDESRYVLNSVHFELKPNAAPIMVATDGRRLCVIESGAPVDEKEDTVLESPINLTVASNFLQALLPFAKKQLLSILPLAIEYHPSNRAIFYLGDCVVDSEKGAVIDIPFPKWREVPPTGTKEPVPELGLNAELMADFVKAAKALDCPDPCVRMNLFTSSAQIEVHLSGKPNFYAVIMPLKTEEQTKNWQPEFLSITKPNLKAA